MLLAYDPPSAGWARAPRHDAFLTYEPRRRQGEQASPHL